ncbi:MAG: metalloregulator ArsR/SmtB family transcription factor [Anaerolineae bacterium]
MEAAFDTLLMFFKALGNENRLRIVGLLAQRDHTVGELAAELGLREPTVSEHLAYLRESGLVTVRAAGTSRIYSFNMEALTALNKAVFSRQKLAAAVEETPEVYEQRVMASFVKEGRITSFPAALKKQLVLLKWIARQIDPDREYSEKEISAFLKQFNEDYATIRRELVDWHFMAREAGRYWMLPEADWQTNPTSMHANS